MEIHRPSHTHTHTHPHTHTLVLAHVPVATGAAATEEVKSLRSAGSP